MVPYIPERYFYIKETFNNNAQGPYALGEIKKMELTHSTLIWRYGLKEWIKIDQLNEWSQFLNVSKMHL